MTAVGAWLTPGPRMAVVGARPVPCAPYGHRGGVAVPLGAAWPSFGRGWIRLAVVVAWPVPWDLSGRRGGVPGPLGPVWPV